jgi:hypothetical protein
MKFYISNLTDSEKEIIEKYMNNEAFSRKRAEDYIETHPEIDKVYTVTHTEVCVAHGEPNYYDHDDAMFYPDQHTANTVARYLASINDRNSDADEDFFLVDSCSLNDEGYLEPDMDCCIEYQTGYDWFEKLTRYDVESRIDEIAHDIAEEYDLPVDYYGDCYCDEIFQIEDSLESEENPYERSKLMKEAEDIFRSYAEGFLDGEIKDMVSEEEDRLAEEFSLPSGWLSKIRAYGRWLDTLTDGYSDLNDRDQSDREADQEYIRKGLREDAESYEHLLERFGRK